MIRILQMKLPVDYSQEDLLRSAAKELHVAPARIRSLHLRKRSLDARKKPDLRYVLTVDVEVEKEAVILGKRKSANLTQAQDTNYQYPRPGEQPLPQRPLIVGSGPAGLFCALLLSRMGYRPLVLERGEDIDSRTRTVEDFWESGRLNISSNVQFGEGGAGTFSDGKLNTLVKDREGRSRFVLQTFVEAGAAPAILYENKPHIGTDVLRTVVKNIRLEIERFGGEVLFKRQVTELLVQDGRLRGVRVNGSEELDCSVLVLAIGHSARDTFQMLESLGVHMEPKAFAVGLRIEHPQQFINLAQYGAEAPPHLPAADYKLTARLAGGRGAYSFCMCPGGYVVNASSEAHMLAVNGMSYQARDGKNANSALVVTVTPQDFGSPKILAGVEFQRRLERFAYQAGEGRIPVQTWADFCQNRASRTLGDVAPCCRGGYALANLRSGLPDFLADSLKEAMLLFDRKISGFARADALLSGIESRTSSPVTIVRDRERMSNIAGLYPCGEGAGYAGGITSAAMDGMKTAEAIIRRYRKF